MEYNLPPKKEYVLYAPLTAKQKDVYQAVLNGAIRRFLIESKNEKYFLPDDTETGDETKETGDEGRNRSTKRRLRKSDVKKYDVGDEDEDEDAYIERLIVTKEEREVQRRKDAEHAMMKEAVEHHRRAAGKRPPLLLCTVTETRSSSF